MSLIDCNECKKQISSVSEHCVFCGFPIRAVSRMISKYRDDRVRSLRDKNGIFQIQCPVALTQMIPYASLTDENVFPSILENCSEYNSLKFPDGISCDFRALSHGIISFHPNNLMQKSAGLHKAFICAHSNGNTDYADSGFFSHFPPDRTVFLLDKYLDYLKKYLSAIVAIFSRRQVPMPYYLVISLLGVIDTGVDSTALASVPLDFGNTPALENNFFLNPIKIAASTNITDDGFYLPIANSIWNGYGKTSFPLDLLNKILSDPL